MAKSEINLTLTLIMVASDMSANCYSVFDADELEGILHQLIAQERGLA